MKRVYCIYKVIDVDTMKLERVAIDDYEASSDGRVHGYGYLDQWRAEDYVQKLVDADDYYSVFIIQPLLVHFNA